MNCNKCCKDLTINTESCVSDYELGQTSKVPIGYLSIRSFVILQKLTTISKHTIVAFTVCQFQISETNNELIIEDYRCACANKVAQHPYCGLAHCIPIVVLVGVDAHWSFDELRNYIGRRAHEPQRPGKCISHE